LFASSITCSLLRSLAGSPSLVAAHTWLHADEGDTASLTCLFCHGGHHGQVGSSSEDSRRGHPAHVRWLKDGAALRVHGAAAHRVRHVVRQHGRVHVLKVKAVRDKDFGHYQCAVNVTDAFGQVTQLQQNIQLSGTPTSFTGFTHVL
jgi:hypothetical protein